MTFCPICFQHYDASNAIPAVGLYVQAICAPCNVNRDRDLMFFNRSDAFLDAGVNNEVLRILAEGNGQAPSPSNVIKAQACNADNCLCQKSDENMKMLAGTPAVASSNSFFEAMEKEYEENRRSILSAKKVEQFHGIQQEESKHDDKVNLEEERQKWKEEKEAMLKRTKEMEEQLVQMTESYKETSMKIDSLLEVMDKKDDEIKRLKLTMQLNNMVRRMQIKDSNINSLIEDRFEKVSDEGFGDGEKKNKSLPKKMETVQNCGNHAFDDYACPCDWDNYIFA